MIKGIHHVAVLTPNAEEMSQFLCELIGDGQAPPAITEIERDELALRTTMIALPSGSVQVLQPGRGPGVSELTNTGEGTIYEIALEVDDIVDFALEVRQRSHVPVDLLGREIDGAFLTAGSGNRYFYLQPESCRGLRIEIIQTMTAR